MSENPVDPNYGEGDPNFGTIHPMKPGGPKLAWAKASDIAIGDKVYLGTVYIHTVVESALEDGGLWRLTFAHPQLDKLNVHSSGKLSARYPKERAVRVNPDFIYRKVIGVMPG
jgi:hypothetical protein